jgi:hypothetical protein
VIGPSNPIEAVQEPLPVEAAAVEPELVLALELDDELDDFELEPQPAANSAHNASVAMMDRPFT